MYILPAGKYHAVLFHPISTGTEMSVHALINSNMPFDLALLTVQHSSDWERVRAASGRFGQIVQITISNLERAEEDLGKFLYGRLITLQP